MGTANKCKLDRERDNYLKLRAKLAKEEGAEFKPASTDEGRRQWAMIKARLVKQWGFNASDLEALEEG